MSNTTDTNQASEDELRREIGSCLNIFPEEFDEYPSNAVGTKNIDAIQSLIRTEKLKLLAEVRERVIGENDRGTITDPDSPWYGEPYESTAADKNEQRAELDKLEAEL